MFVIQFGKLFDPIVRWWIKLKEGYSFSLLAYTPRLVYINIALLSDMDDNLWYSHSVWIVLRDTKPNVLQIIRAVCENPNLKCKSPNRGVIYWTRAVWNAAQLGSQSHCHVFNFCDHHGRCEAKMRHAGQKGETLLGSSHAHPPLECLGEGWPCKRITQTPISCFSCNHDANTADQITATDIVCGHRCPAILYFFFIMRK